MPTVIRFSGGDMSITVSQSPEEVSRALAGANGWAVELKLIDRGQAVFVNPNNIACWQELDHQISPGRMISS